MAKGKALNKKELEELTVEKLRTRCKENKLEADGLKSQLVGRLAKFYKSKAGTGNAKDYVTGYVKNWKSEGFGFIQVGEDVEEGEEKPEQVFVHHHNVTMKEGEKVELRYGMAVRFKMEENSVGKKKNQGKMEAREVTTLSGDPISWFEGQGDKDRVVYEDETYTGVIGAFNFKDQFGYIIPDEEITTPEDDEIDTMTKLSVKFRDFLCDGRATLVPGIKVMFKLYKFRERWGATWVTDPEGEPMKKVDPVKKGKEEIDETTRYEGRVLQFSNNNFGFILPNDDLAEFGVDRKVYFKAEDIKTDAAPASVLSGMEVSFTLYKDKRGVGARDIAMPDGSEIELPEGKERKMYQEVVPRESFPDLEFEGEVTAYFWDKGFGIIKIDFKSNDQEVPEEVKKAIKDEKVYFHWDDITSEDKIVGINRSTKVKFNLYKDKRGIGAECITNPEGEAITGADRTKATFRRKKWGGGKSWGKRKRSWGKKKGWKNKKTRN